MVFVVNLLFESVEDDCKYCCGYDGFYDVHDEFSDAGLCGEYVDCKKQDSSDDEQDFLQCDFFFHEDVGERDDEQQRRGVDDD